jgi:hypothetical protein
MFRRGEYEQIPATNWSSLRSMRVSPKQYAHDLTAAREDTEALRIGLAAHSFLLEPDTFRERYCCYRDSKSKGEGARKKWEQFQADNADKVILSPDEFDRAMGAATAVLGHPVASSFFVGGCTEMVVTWTDKETGIACKARVDQWLRHLVEFKTTRSIQPHMFRVDAARMGYHAQIAWYWDALKQHGVELEPGAILVTVHSEPPHDVVPYSVSEHVIEVGRTIYRELLIKLKRCQETGCWPGISDELIDFDLPEWAYPKDDMKLTMGGLPLEGL